MGNSSNAKYYGIENRDEACEYLNDTVLFNHYFVALQIVQEKLSQKIPVKTLMGSSIDAQKLVSSVTLFKLALEHLLKNSSQSQDYHKLYHACRTVLEIVEKQQFPVCQRTLTAYSKKPTYHQALTRYIEQRTKEWTYHYNFLGLVAGYYWIKDQLTGSRDLQIKCKTNKISAARKRLESTELTPDEQFATSDGRLSRILPPAKTTFRG